MKASSLGPSAEEEGVESSVGGARAQEEEILGAVLPLTMDEKHSELTKTGVFNAAINSKADLVGKPRVVDSF